MGRGSDGLEGVVVNAAPGRPLLDRQIRKPQPHGPLTRLSWALGMLERHVPQAGVIPLKSWSCMHQF